MLASATSVPSVCCSRAWSSTSTTSFHAGFGSTGPSMATRNSPPSGRRGRRAGSEPCSSRTPAACRTPPGRAAAARRGPRRRSACGSLASTQPTRRRSARRTRAAPIGAGAPSHAGTPRRSWANVSTPRSWLCVGDALVLEEHELHVGRPRSAAICVAGAVAACPAVPAAVSALDVGREQPGDAVAVAAGDLGVERRRRERRRARRAGGRQAHDLGRRVGRGGQTTGRP